MGTDDDHLIAQLRIAARKNRQDVAKVGIEGLEEPAVVARRRADAVGRIASARYSPAACPPRVPASRPSIAGIGQIGPPAAANSSALIDSNAA